MQLETWQLTIWITLSLVIISVLLQYCANRRAKEESNKIAKLMLQNKKLSDNIEALRNQITSLNTELKYLTRENQLLKFEVKVLYSRVSNLKIQINANQ